MDADMLLRLDEVPGLDPVGLVVSDDGFDDDHQIVLRLGRGGQVPVRADHVLVRALHSDAFGKWTLRSEVFLSAADPATRDRLARWLAERVGLDIGATAPVFTFGRHYGGGAVLAAPARMVGWSEHTSDVPALASIDRDDPRADWLALAAVCRHVGGAGV